MGMMENWQAYLDMTRDKAASHAKAAQFWDFAYNVLGMSLIFLSTLTTLSTLLPIHPYFATVVGGMTTLVSAINGSVNPSARRQAQMESSKNFKALMLRMVRCETEVDYENLWTEFNKDLATEPFLPKKFQVKEATKYTMTPEFQILVHHKTTELMNETGGIYQNISKEALSRRGGSRSSGVGSTTEIASRH